MIYRAHGKRLIDLSVSLIVLVVGAPAILLVALLVRINLGSPVLFRQTRLGLCGRPFTMYKFRSMSDEHDGSGKLLPDADRLTSFGRFMRGTSLDELPELLNVLKGEMSLVGPRPLLPDYLPRYTPEQMRRHDVKPGVTGWAQVNGRNAISWEERFALDTWYARHISPALDLKIVLLTLVIVTRRDGISQQGHATMPEFMGTRQGAQRQ